MITVTDAERFILDSIRICPAKELSLPEAYGLVLREDVFADRDQPAFHRATMDGIAIAFSSWKAGQKSFSIAGAQKAGVADQGLKDKTKCLEIMTGAVLPEGSDCVVPVEDIEIRAGIAHIRSGAKFAARQNVHQQAADYRRGEKLLAKGTVLNPPQIAVAAAVGKARIKVSAPPKIAVIGTGDELVEIDKPVKLYQTRRSNVYALQATLQLNGFSDVKRFHLRDNKKELLSSLKKILWTFDVLILSGGVSMGKFDLVPESLQALGVQVIFHQVKQRPGKPFWFGKTKNEKPVFALPGNPVSTQVCAVRYVLPYLRRAVGLPDDCFSKAVLTNAWEVKGELTQFLPVKISGNSHAQIAATPVSFGGSGDFAALREAQGFVELPTEPKSLPAGSVVRLFLWR